MPLLTTSYFSVLNAIAEDSDNVSALVAEYLQNEGVCNCFTDSKLVCGCMWGVHGS